jgi:membrane protein required for colicin V production
MMAGLATTALIITGSFLIAEPLLPTNNQPDWVRDSRSLVLIRASAKLLSAVLPENALLIGTEKAEDAAEKAREIIELDKTYRRLIEPEKKKPGAPERPGYDDKDRRALDRLIQTRE